jgi:hypothetical protein
MIILCIYRRRLYGVDDRFGSHPEKLALSITSPLCPEQPT